MHQIPFMVDPFWNNIQVINYL